MGPPEERGLFAGLVLSDLFASLRTAAEADDTSLRSPGKSTSNSATAAPAPGTRVQPIQSNGKGTAHPPSPAPGTTAQQPPRITQPAPAFAGMVPRRFVAAAAPAPPQVVAGNGNKSDEGRNGQKDGTKSKNGVGVAATPRGATAGAAVLGPVLPVHAHMPAILAAINGRRVTCIRGTD
jgi:hypothetical protein